MEDFFKRPIAVGDRVAFVETHYRNFKLATITAMTPQKVRLEWRQGSSTSTTLRFPHEVIKR